MSVVPDRILAAWPGLTVDAAPYGSGLINLTLKGSFGGAQSILQRVHPAFAPSVHLDIEAVTSHLAAKGVRTPRLVPTASGERCALDDEGRPWRLLSFIEDSFSFDRLADPRYVSEAGRIVASFHTALRDLQHEYAHVRPGIHDVEFRKASLTAALAARADHRLAATVRDLASQLQGLDALLLSLEAGLPRHSHGDLKASNVLFDDRGQALCLVDLDTLATMIWPFEMGDAIRSWCNPKREDEPGAKIDMVLYEAALEGYARGSAGLELEPRDVDLLPRGVLTIAAELAMRFLTDALEERYFSFDARRFSGRGEHNLARAKGQIELAHSVASELPLLERTARRVLHAR